MSVGLNGSIEDFGIAEVFQLIGQQRKTGLLELSRGDQAMCLAFSNGAVVRAGPAGDSPDQALADVLVRCGLIGLKRLRTLMREAQRFARPLHALLVSKAGISSEQLDQTVELLTRETIFQVLRWTSGSFHFTAQSVPCDTARDRLLGAEQILMDGLRMLDEWRTFARQVPSEDAVFRSVRSFEGYRQKVGSMGAARLSQAEKVFDLIDGSRSVRCVIDRSMLGTFEATRVLAELREAGMIERVAAPRVAAAIRTGSRPARMGPWIVGAVATAGSLLLLALIASSTSPPLAASSAQVVDSFPVPRQPMEVARRSFEKRRIRHALEAHRYLSGSWPETLVELERTGLAEASAWTASAARPYYYERRPDGPLLLATPR